MMVEIYDTIEKVVVRTYEDDTDTLLKRAKLTAELMSGNEEGRYIAREPETKSEE